MNVDHMVSTKSFYKSTKSVLAFLLRDEPFLPLRRVVRVFVQRGGERGVSWGVELLSFVKNTAFARDPGNIVYLGGCPKVLEEERWEER